ncbi:putative secreted protein (Por secretion system target) [Lutibacter oceani]|uniref:Putative secreted protein (Por secretion system target) n=1 Tax=Lutibacter oceani TaxID=1853311 RepID=A0A3D9S0V5_9FLAO|nr:IPT/TIG domain-containing protein [Lutibacter oceani]REE83454.1 putative secreted protein (Por secretion system target) [Lutibacter oceani]
MFKNLLLGIVLICSFFTGYGQTLSAGDIAFVQYNADNTDDFSFLTLKDIPAGEIIYFTDDEENLDGNEGTIAWTSPAGGVSCGTVVTITTSPSTTLGSVSETNDLNFGGSGDSILAYQGSTGSPTFIAALHNDGSADTWGGTLGGNLPTGLTDGATAVAIAEIDNAAYNGTLTGTKSTILAAINNSGNWSGSNTVNQTFSGTFVISDCAAASPTITVSPTSLTGLDYVFGSGPSAEQTFTASGTDLVNNVTGNITLTAPSNFEISTTSGSGFSGSITLTQSGGVVASTTIYVRLASGLAISTYGPSNITADSSGATTQNVSVSGEVTAPTATCDELFISEYIEGSSNNKFIEIYNPTGSSINLTGYSIVLYTNGSSSASTSINLSGSIAANDVFVLENSSETLGVAADQSSGSLTFNGDDAVSLEKSGSIIDVIGQIGTDPGSEWVGTTCTQGTADGTLVRNASVQSGDSDGSNSFNPDTEWTCYNQDNVSNLGSHTSNCASTTPTINVSADAVSLLNYTFGSGPSAAQSFSVEGLDLTTDITITAPTNFEISTSSGSGFGSSLTLTQTGGTVASTTIYVRLAAGLAINSYTGDLDATSTGATTKNVTFNGDVLCIAAHTITSFTPASGPIGTEVTITGTGFTASSTVEFDGNAATVTYVNATTLIAEVPAGTVSNYIKVTESGCDLNSTSNFTIISDNGCVGGSIPAGWTDLMFTGVYDDEILSCHYIELFNPTSSDIDLSNYTFGFDNNFTFPSVVPVTGFTGLVTLTGTIPAESTFMVQVTTISGGCTSCPTITPDYTVVGSIGLNVDDRLVLVESYGTGSATAIDVWQNHSSELADPLFDKGYVFARDISATAPSTAFNLSDWTYDGTEDCFGFAISSAVLPTINTQPTDVTTCNAASFTVGATAGNGGTLSYQWKYNDGSSTGWTNVTSATFSPGTVTGEMDTNLVISGYDANGYQFYCEVTEDLSCSVASNAAQVKTDSKTWNGSTWSPSGAPGLGTAVIINGNYSTAANGSFSACSLVVNSTFTLTVDDNTYVEVENNTNVYGTILVQTKGAFVQNNDNGTFTLNGGTASVNKETAPINAWYEYTYWSSPVENETIGGALVDSPSSRRFWFNANNWEDATYETNNDNTAISGAGIDNVDDNGDDWQIANAGDTMIPGVGYAATYSSSLFTSNGQQYNYTFEGAFNTGTITVPVVINTEPGDVDWNFIGNPYPSAINSDLFIAANTGVMQGALYFWSHNTPPSKTANGNQVLNFSEDDYGIYNGAGSIVAGDGIVPDGFIPSGQGFFVAASASGNVVFNNAMRIADTSSNNQFFKGSKAKKASKSDSETNKIWLNLTSDNGVFSQLLVGYLDGATNANDGMFYDVPRFLTKTGSSAILYSNIEEEATKYYAIQGKNSNSLDRNESISLGFTSTIKTESEYKIEIDRFEGEFFANNTIYLKDNALEIYHELSASDYVFTSGAIEYKNRFEIVFKDSRLPINNLNSDELVIYELEDGTVQFTVNDTITIKNITIIDLLGRTLYKLKGNSYTEIFNLSGLSNAMYIAKVELSNGNFITKKALKRK